MRSRTSCLWFKAEIELGSDIKMAARDAVDFTGRTGCSVEFDFNGKNILVTKETTFEDILIRYEGINRNEKDDPGLLEVCEAMMEYLDHGTPIHSGAVIASELKAAIAKAKGL